MHGKCERNRRGLPHGDDTHSRSSFCLRRVTCRRRFNVQMITFSLSLFQVLRLQRPRQQNCFSWASRPSPSLYPKTRPGASLTRVGRLPRSRAPLTCERSAGVSSCYTVLFLQALVVSPRVTHQFYVLGQRVTLSMWRVYAKILLRIVTSVFLCILDIGFSFVFFFFLSCFRVQII